MRPVSSPAAAGDRRIGKGEEEEGRGGITSGPEYQQSFSSSNRNIPPPVYSAAGMDLHNRQGIFNRTIKAIPLHQPRSLFDCCPGTVIDMVSIVRNRKKKTDVHTLSGRRYRLTLKLPSTKLRGQFCSISSARAKQTIMD